MTSAAASNGLLTADFNGTVPAPSVSGGASDGDDVSCVAHAVAALSDAGAISSPQGETVVSIAAQSPCKTRP